MGQILSTAYNCHCNCFNKEKEEAYTAHNNQLTNPNCSGNTSPPKIIYTIPILFPKVNRKDSNELSVTPGDRIDKSNLNYLDKPINSNDKSSIHDHKSLINEIKSDIDAKDNENNNNENYTYRDDDKSNPFIQSNHINIISDFSNHSGIMVQSENIHSENINNINHLKPEGFSNSCNTLTKITTQTKTINPRSRDSEHFKQEEDNQNIKYIDDPSFIQAFVRGVLLRKYFLTVKSTWRIKSEAICNSYMNDYNKIEYTYVEGYAPQPFSINGYLKNDNTKSYQPLKFFGKIDKDRFLLCKYDKIQSLYYGSLNKMNERHGHGILYTSKGQKYEGTWVNNKFTGWGRLIEINNDKAVTEGVFLNGKINGFGKKYWSDKIYEGNFKDGKMQGKGKENSNVFSYEGEYVNNLKNGKGKVIYNETNDVYEGDFKDNCLTGNGYYIWNNKHTYFGEFLNGDMHGKGKYTWPEGGYYIGEYLNNIKQGYGEFKWPDGKIYKGPFKDGQPDGKGVLIIRNKEGNVEFSKGKVVNIKKN